MALAHLDLLLLRKNYFGVTHIGGVVGARLAGLLLVVIVAVTSTDDLGVLVLIVFLPPLPGLSGCSLYTFDPAHTSEVRGARSRRLR